MTKTTRAMNVVTPPAAHWALRAFWLGMLLAHLPGLGATLLILPQTGPAEWARALVLLLANSFFILKLADVAALRVPFDRRAWLLATLALALLHAGAVERRLGRDPFSTQAVPAEVVGAMLLALAVTPGARRLEAVRSGVRRTHDRDEFTRLLGRLQDAWRPPAVRLLTSAGIADRAPPR